MRALRVALLWFVVCLLIGALMLSMGGVGVGELLVAMVLSTVVTWLITRRRHSRA